MEPEEPPMKDDPQKVAPIPLDYVPVRERRGFGAWLSTRLTRLSRPMPLGTYYLIMFVLSIIGTIIAVIIALIMQAFR